MRRWAKQSNFEAGQVIGIYDKTLTAPDNTVIVSLRDAQQLFYTQLPAIVQQR